MPPPKKKTSKALIGLLACGGLFILVIIIGAIAGGGSKKTDTATGGAPTTTAAPKSGDPTTAAPTTAAPKSGDPTTAAPTTAAPTTATENVIGTPVNEDGVIFTVTAVKDPALPEQFTTVKTGERLLSLEITAKNTKDKNEVVSSMMCFSLKTADGTAGDMQIMGAQGASKNLDGTLLPGESLKGSLTFTVPANAQGLYLKINCGISGGSVIQLHA